jgi:hypothetical protein
MNGERQREWNRQCIRNGVSAALPRVGRFASDGRHHHPEQRDRYGSIATVDIGPVQAPTRWGAHRFNLVTQRSCVIRLEMYASPPTWTGSARLRTGAEIAIGADDGDVDREDRGVMKQTRMTDRGVLQ